MKIVYLVDIFPKVSETFVRDEAVWVDQQGWLERILSLDCDTQLLAGMPSSIQRKTRAVPREYIRRFHRYALGMYWLARAPRRFLTLYRSVQGKRHESRLFWRAAQLAVSLRCGEARVLHAHFAGNAAKMARYVGFLTGIPFTITAHRYDIFSEPPDNYPQLARDAIAIITISDFNRDYLARYHQVPREKLRLVRCGVDVDRFRRIEPRPKRAAVRMVTVGRLIQIKAHADLIDACDLLKRDGFEFSLRIVGDGELRASLQRRIDRLGLGEHILLLGAKSSEQVLGELQAADLFVMTSTSEGIPVVLMEAMATELPVVATRVNGIPELVEHGRTGLLVQPGAPAELAEAIRQAIANEQQSRAFGLAGRAKVLAEYNAQDQYARLAEIWTGYLTCAPAEA